MFAARPWRFAAALFGATTVFVVVLFVRALGEQEIRSGLATYGALTAAAAVGMWRGRRWGRNIGLLIALGNIGLGTVATLAVIVSRDGDATGPLVLLVTNLVLAFVLTRPPFDV